MVANGERDGQISEGNGVCHYIVMTSAANLTKVVFAWPPQALSFSLDFRRHLQVNLYVPRRSIAPISQHQLNLLKRLKP